MSSAPTLKVQIAPLPDYLIQYPCSPVGPGRTVSSLARGYTQNTGCIGEYKSAMDGIKQYNEKQKELNNGEAGRK